MAKNDWIERRIITGLIVSDDYIQKINEVWNPDLLKSATSKTIAKWCMDYYQQYAKAPNRDIQGIFTAQLKRGMNEEHAQDIEEILEDLSEDYERESFNVDYLLDESFKYFSLRSLQNHVELIKNELDSENITEAEKLAISYNKIQALDSHVIDPFTREAVSIAFKKQSEPLIRFGKAMGRMIDAQCIRGAFLAFIAPEKRGKSQILLEFAMRGVLSNYNIAFFQAGDMTDAQQIKRICTWLAKKSTDEKYCGELLIPVVDCINNQTDACVEVDREGDCGLYVGKPFEDLSYDEILYVFKENKKYIPCGNEKCPKRNPTIWYKYRPTVDPLTEIEAYKIIRKFRKKYKKKFKLATYSNETLTCKELTSVLDTWERNEMFVPDIIIIDYADIMAPDSDCTRMEFRHQENKKWQRIRKISQERHALLVTATQSDADSYKRELLSMANFSETKTKFAHVTAMYGLNQTPREKSMGLMRINEIVIREGDFNSTNAVHVLQRLQIGRPYLGSY